MNDSQPLIGTASQTIWLPPLMDQLQEKVEQPNGEPPKNKKQNCIDHQSDLTNSCRLFLTSRISKVGKP